MYNGEEVPLPPPPLLIQTVTNNAPAPIREFYMPVAISTAGVLS
jgi:hypothetical protein